MTSFKLQGPWDFGLRGFGFGVYPYIVVPFCGLYLGSYKLNTKP